MKYDEFINRVRELAGVSPEEARQASRAVLLTLSERIGPKESADTASQLPKGLKEAFMPGAVPDPFDAEEFLRRVAQRMSVSLGEALNLTRAVFLTLREAVSPGELEDWQEMLTPDYVELAARPAEPGGKPRTTPPDSPHRRRGEIGARDFIERVAGRAGLDEEHARRATEVVLETLGERIAHGEAEDLAAQLDEPLAEPLLRPGGDAQPIPADAFVQRVAEREGEPLPLAQEHARAVLTTLREAVTVDEWHDTEAELSRDYQTLLA
jgi:uncharacterized protein (DUF2267 family)